MKKKKLEKIAKIIATKLEEYRSTPIAESEKINWSPYDQEVSAKFKKMFINLVQHRENIRLETSQNYISISVEDITSIKKKQPIISSRPLSDDNYLRLEISKEGFRINKGYRQQCSFKDVNIYDELIDEIIQIEKAYNSDTFNSVWNDIMKESGIVRDHNLDELFNG